MTAKKTEAEEYAAAVEAGKQAQPRAVDARYDHRHGRLVVELNNGVVLMIPAKLLQGLSGAGTAQLADIEILASGYALRWPALDADFTVPGLAQGIFGTKRWMEELKAQHFAEAGRKGGSKSTPAKTQAARVNGKLGGRPRRVVKPSSRVAA
jgi:hypothetical protein